MTQHRGKKAGAATFLRSVAGWVVILAALLVVVVAVLLPRIAGATPYTILTGSMAPGHPPGTLVVTRPVEARDVEIGDVLTYQLRSGEPAVVTHRVVAQGVDSSGEIIFRTQGDANQSPDPEWVRPVQIRGELWYAVPFLGHAGTVLSGNERQIGVLVVAGLLLAYASTMFVASARDRRSAHHREEEIAV